MASNLRRSKRTIGRRLSYIETKLNVSRRSNIPRRLAPGAVTGPSLSPDVNSTLSTIQTTADGKNSIYRQTTQPTGGSYVEGDLWFDTDDGNKFYRYTSGVWTGFTLGNSALASISANKITAGSLDASVIVTSNLDAGQITAGAISSIEIRAGSPSGGLYPFRVGTDGSLRATNATIEGQITSSSGKIGAFTIGAETLTASSFGSWPQDTSGSLSIGDNGQIVGTVNKGSFYGTPYSTTVTINANSGEGIKVVGTGSGVYRETRILSSFIDTRQVFIAGGDVQTLLNGKSNSGHDHDNTNWGGHTHSYMPTGGITQSGDVVFENTASGTNSAGQPLQLRRKYASNGDNFIQFVRVASTTPATFSELAVTSIEFISSTRADFNHNSDYRIKEDITDVDSGLDVVRQLRPVNYKMKDGGTNEYEDGFIAQELYEVYPYSVSKGSDELDENGNLVRPWGVYYGTFIPILTSAIKQLLAKVETLEEKVAQLEAR